MQKSWAGRSAVVAPGGNYGADGPLLMYAALAVQRRGGESRRIAWELPGGLDFSDGLEIDGADHGMFVSGRLADSAAVLGQVITAVEDFLDRIA